MFMQRDDQCGTSLPDPVLLPEPVSLINTMTWVLLFPVRSGGVLHSASNYPLRRNILDQVMTNRFDSRFA